MNPPPQTNPSSILAARTFTSAQPHPTPGSKTSKLRTYTDLHLPSHLHWKKINKKYPFASSRHATRMPGFLAAFSFSLNLASGSVDLLGLLVQSSLSLSSSPFTSACHPGSWYTIPPSSIPISISRSISIELPTDLFCPRRQKNNNHTRFRPTNQPTDRPTDRPTD